MNPEVTSKLDALNHVLRAEIQILREIILNCNSLINENYKWNGPNYSFQNEDRITMRIHPPNKIQLIFHRGAKKLALPENRIIQTTSKLLEWKENDRAVITFKNREDILLNRSELIDIVDLWLKATA